MGKATASAAINGTQEEPGNNTARMYEVNLTWPLFLRRMFSIQCNPREEEALSTAFQICWEANATVT